MSDIFGSVFGIIWFILVFTFIKKAVKKSSGGSSTAKTPQTPRPTPQRVVTPHQVQRVKPPKKEVWDDEEPDIPKPPRKAKAGEARPARSFLKETSALSDLMVEDRHNDWLARQIREEKRHVVWNNFVDLGAAHDEACAAELNAREHKRRHQSYVVDDGITDN